MDLPALAARIARDRALLEARLADLPRLRAEARRARKRSAELERTAEARWAQFHADQAAARAAAAEAGRAKRKAARLERRRRKRARHREAAVRGAPLPRMVPTEPAVPRQFYVTRNAILASLGYPTYAEYLASDRWAGIRRSVLKRDGWLCRLCGGAAAEVHHASYSRAALLGRETTHLHSVCRECHEWVEFRPGRGGEPQRRSPKEMVAETYRLLRARLETPVDEAAASIDLNAEAAARISREE